MDESADASLAFTIFNTDGGRLLPTAHNHSAVDVARRLGARLRERHEREQRGSRQEQEFLHAVWV